MTNRFIFSTVLLGASAVAMVVRDMQSPLEAPPVPSWVLQQTQGLASSPGTTGVQVAIGDAAAGSVSDTQHVSVNRSQPASLNPPQPANPGQTSEQAVAENQRGDRLIDFLNRANVQTVSRSRDTSSSSTPSSATASSATAAVEQADRGETAKSKITEESVAQTPQAKSPAPATPEESERFAPPPPKPTENTPTSGGDQLSSQINFGGGAVTIAAPADWRVYEVSAGREVRLTVTPREIESRSDDLEGLWIACHGRLRTTEPPKDFEQLLQKRLRNAVSNATSTEIQTAQFGPDLGYVTEYNVEGAVGFHAIIPAPWGVCEVHARTEAPAGMPQLRKIINSLSINDGPRQQMVTNSRIQDSAGILGAWKAYRSRLRLSGDGRIEIEPESDSVRALGEEPKKPAKVLRGEFEARDDLLFVRWDDGSFLNFRWRLDGDSLLLTDHEGRVSELRLLLE